MRKKISGLHLSFLGFLARYQKQNTSYEEIYEVLDEGSRPHVDYYVLMVVATVIASFGLLMNSAAIIIGAMIVSPLMEPMLGISFASLIRNAAFTFRSTFTLTSGIVLAIFLSFIIGLSFSTLGPTEEIMVRTKPNILDLFVALAAGFMGAYVKIRRTISGSIYGVAIAISLIPPLCVVGLGLAFMNESIYLGALLLFLTNLASIVLSSLLAFMLIDYPHLKISFKTLIIPASSVVILAIPLIFSFVMLVEERKLSRELRDILKLRTLTFENLEIIDVETDLFKKPIELKVIVRATPEQISENQVQLVQNYLVERLNKPVHLIVHLSPVQQIEAQLPVEAKRK